jgi:hypothetical protein
MRAIRSTTEIIAYKIDKYDLARAVLGDTGTNVVTVDATPDSAEVTIIVRREIMGEETELEN